MDKSYAENSPIKNLVVIDLPHADNVKIEGWDWKWEHFFAAENCDRQLLIGFTDDLQYVPQALKDAAISDNTYHKPSKTPPYLIPMPIIPIRKRVQKSS